MGAMHGLAHVREEGSTTFATRSGSWQPMESAVYAVCEALQLSVFPPPPLMTPWCVQPEAPLSFSGTSGAIATLVWQLAAKENQLDKVQDELWQVG